MGKSHEKLDINQDGIVSMFLLGWNWKTNRILGLIFSLYFCPSPFMQSLEAHINNTSRSTEVGVFMSITLPCINSTCPQSCMFKSVSR